MTTAQVSTTSNPSNASEWQLYRVLQRANLLQYYDVFVAQGGDDVQQLCEAGEEEFLEIMALVGMASKPLHVRRLQKALQEWVANPAAFQVANVIPPAPLKVASLVNSQQRDSSVGPYSISSTSPSVGATVWSPNQVNNPTSGSPVNTVASPGLYSSQASSQVMSSIHGETIVISDKPQSSSPVPIPVLVESQINTIAKSATRLAKGLPMFEPKPLNMKKDINRQILMVMQMEEEDPSRLEQMRKFGAIYGRFDSKRRNDRPMSLHEISVNEASAQLCCHIPNLLTRREDLFPLARQIVKDSGYHYSKGHSRASELDPQNPSKKQKMDYYVSSSVEPSFLRVARAEIDRLQRDDRLGIISKELAQIASRQEEIKTDLAVAKETNNMVAIDKLESLLEQTSSKHTILMTEQNELVQKQSYSFNSGELHLELENESILASNSCSPNPSDSGDSSAEVQLKAILANSSLTHQLICNSHGKDLQNTLFDEGLRIAQQYGMSDFELELKQLQGDPADKNDDQEVMDELNKTDSSSKNTAEVIAEVVGTWRSSRNRERQRVVSTMSTRSKTLNGVQIKQEVVESDGENSLTQEMTSQPEVVRNFKQEVTSVSCS